MASLASRWRGNSEPFVWLMFTRSMWRFCVVLVGMAGSAAISAELPVHTPVPGGIAVLPIAPASGVKPLAKFGNRELLVSRDADNWFALIGLPCDILPGNYIVRVELEPGEFGSIELAVSPFTPRIGRYKEDEGNSDAVNGSNEKNQWGQIVATEVGSDTDFLNPNLKPVARKRVAFSGAMEPNFNFLPVVEFAESIAYGKLIQNKKTVTHDYVSYIGVPGSQVYSPSTGNVVKVIESENQGITVHISHGGGVFSILGHLEQVLVHEGQPLDAGEQIGSTRLMNNSEQGKLDWGVQMNGYLVNPLILRRASSVPSS